LNLATNAADAMPEGGRLAFETQNVSPRQASGFGFQELRTGDYVLLTVSDTGQGMEADTLDQVFDPFFTTKEPGKGTGLGLSTVFGIVKAHHGHIHCVSEPGKGTTFHVLFPAADETQSSAMVDQGVSQAAGQSPIPADKNSGRRNTILVVDDETALRTLGSKLLENFGYEALMAESGEQALEVYQAARDRVSLVVMDLNMPGMGGLNSLKRLREIDPQARVLVASGYYSPQLVDECRQAGAAGFLNKPYRRAELLDAIQNILEL
jgi:CheY-like chemotaxis protein